MASSSISAGGGGGGGAAAASHEHRPVRFLKGHSQSLLCCISPPANPHLVATSGEDGMMCIFDLRSEARPQKFEKFGEAVVSLCHHSGNENHIIAAAGQTIYLMDVRLGPDGGELCKFQFNTDEINQVAINQSGTFIAASDDSGEAKVIDLRGQKVFKTLRGGHVNICSSVQFHPKRSWEVLTGGLDCKIINWDFSRGKLIKGIDLSLDPGNSAHDFAGVCNPPFVHALAVSERDVSGETGQVLAVARGDGVVEVYNVEFDRSKSSVNKGPNRSINSSHRKQKEDERSHSDALDCKGTHGTLGRICQLGSVNGGHTAAVSHVTFSRFGENGSLLVSGGNDACLKLWNWSSCYCSSSKEQESSPLRLNILHREKINWISTIASSSDNLLVAGTSTYLTIYSIL
ncbi:hypothetical protein O6H91_07G111000 [Diphasiastrum complanatum]|uniref:Uncharacterized protein n=1 Tax=Diphasiastrum complanatum TaxID=34168 RepID=A0ACC2D8I8_DIPCM|nr:hypothetical protein O6H91_07G111000 [Diphasiastrum complanatum]